MHAYLLALEIEPVTTNTVYVALPLHCTVVHWFRSELAPADILKAVTPIVEATKPVELISGAADMFGEDNDVPVNRLTDDEKAMELHKSLHTALKNIGVVDVAPKWTQDGFNMHVTRQRSGRFEEGRTHTASRLYLVEAMVPEQLQQKKIIERLHLRGQA